ncbi:hypothetical protein Sjap_020958 [Stephania japonica]|uniref:Uncharacterized protein n=1 Tax=Stephania japonica TaxID=461633 RepID=A0AAP0FAN3_9MAGN
MKGNQISKDSPEKQQLLWDQMIGAGRTPTGTTTTTITVSSQTASRGGTALPLPRLMVWLILFVTLTYLVYTLKLVSTSRPPCTLPTNHPLLMTHQSHFLPTITNKSSSSSSPNQTDLIIKHDDNEITKTGLQHIVFGIAASAKLWADRKNYIKLWYNPEQMRGVVWLDKQIKQSPSDKSSLPPIKISADTSRFSYKNKQGHRSAIRISRIVSETFRMGVEGVRWFVMGDDDTVFVAENLVRVLNKYDHREMWYIGSLSESHLQNIYFSYGMAYGGGGFAISYPLARALVRMQDSCIQRYPGLYGSDDRMQACMAELGVPLTKELGFHQYDVYGNLFGLLAAHPVTPLVTLHHLDVVEPIFPNMTRVQALHRLMEPMKLDSAGLMQQSICYDKEKTWTVSVSWGFAVQIYRGVFSPREMEIPSRTFLNWYRRADYTAYAFNTRPVSRNECQKPFVFYMSNARLDPETNRTVSEYLRNRVPHPSCRWKMADPGRIERVVVYKRPDPHLWDKRSGESSHMAPIDRSTALIDRTEGGSPCSPLLGLFYWAPPPPASGADYAGGPLAASQRATTSLIRPPSRRRNGGEPPLPSPLHGSYGVGEEEPSSGAPTPSSNEDEAPLWGPTAHSSSGGASLAWKILDS